MEAAMGFGRNVYEVSGLGEGDLKIEERLIKDVFYGEGEEVR